MSRLGDGVAGLKWTMILALVAAVIVILALFAVWPQPSSSESCGLYDPTCTITWTTDEDFDAGDKGLNGTDYFTETGADQPFEGHPAGYYSAKADRTYVAYTAYQYWRSATNSSLVAKATFYDHETGVWAEPTTIGVFDVDGHGGPSIWVDEGSGYIYVYWGSHVSDQYLSRSVSKWTTDDGWILLDPSPTISAATYPILFRYGNYQYLLRRFNYADGGDWVWQKSRFSTHLSTWTSPQIVFDSVAPDGIYLAEIVQRGSDVWWLFQGYAYQFNRYNTYLCRWDLTTNHQKGMDGVDLGLTVTISEANDHCLVHETGQPLDGQTTSNSAFDLDVNNTPHVVMTEGLNWSSSGGLGYFINYTRWNGSAWTTPITITYTDGTTNYHAVDAMSDPNLVTLFVTTSGSLEIDDGRDDYGGDVQRWTVSNDGNDTVTFQGTIMSEARNGMPVDRPRKVINGRSDALLLFDSWIPYGFEWGPKQLSMARLYLWGSHGFVRNNDLMSNTWLMQSGSDNSQWANEIQPAQVRGDLFNGINTTDDANNYFWQGRYGGDGTDDIFSKIGPGGFYVNSTYTSGTGRHESALISRFTVAPPYDFRVKFEKTDGENFTGEAFGRDVCILNQPDTCYTGNFQDGTYGYMMEVILNDDQPQARMNLFAIENGVLGDPVGAIDNNICYWDSCYVRLEWDGIEGALDWYWSVDGADWFQEFEDVADGSHFDDPTNQTLDTLYYPGFAIFANLLTSSWSFKMSPDIADAVLYAYVRRDGPVEYSTQEFTSSGAYANLVVSHIRMGYRLGDGDWITAVELIDTTSGQVYWTNQSGVINTDTEEFVDFDVVSGIHNWRFRVYGTANPSSDGTMAITSIVISLTRTGFSQITLWWMPWIMFFLVMAIILILAYWFKRKRGF